MTAEASVRMAQCPYCKTLAPVRQRATWVRWDKATMSNVTSHPWLWFVTEPDGYERSFNTKREADAWVRDYLVEADYQAEERD